MFLLLLSYVPIVSNFSESHLSEHFKDNGNYRVTIKNELTCTKVYLMNSPQDSNIRKYDIPTCICI